MSLSPLEELEQVLAYDPETGLLTVLKPLAEKTGSEKQGTYLVSQAGRGLWGKTFHAHRIAWLLYHKNPPREGYGHLNGNKSDKE